MFGREKEKPIDVNRLVASAVDAFLNVEPERLNGRVEKSAEKSQSRGIGPVGSIAVGLALAAGARAVYSRAKRLDLQEAAEKVEERLAH